MKGRINLQPSITLTAISGQDLQNAGRVAGGAKSGIAVVTVTTTSPATGTLQILTAPELNVDLAGWASVGSTTSLNTTGVKIITLTGMADFIRWNLSAITGSVTLSITVYAFDA